MSEDTVTISKKEYNQLCNDSAKLAALECAGVDNWQGYELALDILEDWQNAP